MAKTPVTEEMIFDEVRTELRRAEGKFGPFASAHEGYAVLLEEVDELWDAIKANDLVGKQTEALHVGAMAVRFVKMLWNLR